MGCYLSKNLFGDSNSHIFRVYNINDLGPEKNAGTMEVTDHDLIFYQKRKEPIRWPLSCLRRYGFDKELFSFESGRRCTTGSAIYAFKCKRAKELFKLVQDAIEIVGQNSLLISSQIFTNETLGIGIGHSRSRSRPVSLVEPLEPLEIHPSRISHVTVAPSDLHLYTKGSVTLQEDMLHNYVNTTSNKLINTRNELKDYVKEKTDFPLDLPMAPPPPKPETVAYAEPNLPKSTENMYEASNEVIAGAAGESIEPRASCAESDCQNGFEIDVCDLNSGDLDVFGNTSYETFYPNYMNVGDDCKVPDNLITSKIEQSFLEHRICKNLLLRRSSVDHNSSTLGAASFNVSHPSRVIMNPAGILGANSSPSSTNRLSISGILNYIEIDVNKTDCDSIAGTSTSCVLTVPDLPGKHTEGYAIIDFNRTVALANSAKPSSDDEEGLRKTRHNSTMF